MISLTINGIEKKSYVQAFSLNINKTISKKRNNCSFVIVSTKENTYKPNVGQEVIVYDGATKIFGGVITSIESNPMSANIVNHSIQCQDYSRLLDRKLVPDSFSNQTVNEIITSLKNSYFPADITINNVNCPVTIKTARFNYKPIVTVLEELAKKTNYDWYVDYDKDLHFFEKNSETAPFEIEDDNGSYVLDSLKIRTDNTQLRNVIIVRGGEYDGSTFTSEIEANGTDFIFNLPYRYTDFQATLTGNVLNTGIDYLNDPNNHDALYNFNEKILRFKEADKPSTGAVLRISGKPKLPVIVKYTSPSSIASTLSVEGGSDGIYEYLIVDKSISSKEEARQRARVEVEGYGESLIEASFTTYTSGLEVGQRLRINSTLMGVDEYYIINSIRINQRTADGFEYDVDLVSQKTYDLIDILKNLILKDTENIEINENEVIDILINVEDSIRIQDSATITVSGNGNYKYEPNSQTNSKWNFSTWQ